MNSLFRGRNAAPMIFQSEMNECGLACLAMICGYHGKRIDIRTLRSLYALSAAGASVKHLLQAAEQIDLQGRPLKLELSDLSRLTLPVILHWDLDHFVVLTKVSARHTVVHDPAVGIRKYRTSELAAHFTGIAVEFTPSSTFQEQSEQPAYSLRHLIQTTPSFYRAVIQIFLLSLLIQVLTLLTPLYLQLVIDQGISKGDMSLIFLIAVLFFFATAAKLLVGYGRGIMILQFSNQLGFHLLSNAFRHLLRLPMTFFERRELGDIVSRFSSLEAIKQLVTQDMITVLVDGLFSLITVVLLFLYSPFLTWIVLGFVLVFTMLRVAAIPIEKNRRQETLVTNAKQQSRFMENIKSISVTKINGIERERESDWQGVYADFINSGYQLGRFQLGVASLQGLIFGLDHIVTIYFASVMVHTGALTLGQMMSFIFLKQHFSNSIAAMLPKLAELRLMKLELERVADIALQKPENLTPLPLLFGSQLIGKIEARELSFSYPNNEHRVFHELNFLIDPGSCVAITGKSGCGKSTLLKIILGLEKPDSGKIVFDDRDQASIGVTALRDQVSAIMHSDQLLSGDIAYNINLGTEPYNEQRLKRACDRAGIFEAICKLPMNFRTQVGEMGSIFSAGQVQRLLLARALYRLPRILVLDEALSHLGNDTSKSLLQSISGLGITVLLVTHNPELVKVATHIIRLE